MSVKLFSKHDIPIRYNLFIFIVIAAVLVFGISFTTMAAPEDATTLLDPLGPIDRNIRTEIVTKEQYNAQVNNLLNTDLPLSKRVTAIYSLLRNQLLFVESEKELGTRAGFLSMQEKEVLVRGITSTLIDLESRYTNFKHNISLRSQFGKVNSSLYKTYESQISEIKIFHGNSIFSLLRYIEHPMANKVIASFAASFDGAGFQYLFTKRKFGFSENTFFPNWMDLIAAEHFSNTDKIKNISQKSLETLDLKTKQSENRTALTNTYIEKLSTSAVSQLFLKNKLLVNSKSQSFRQSHGQGRIWEVFDKSSYNYFLKTNEKNIKTHVDHYNPLFPILILGRKFDTELPQKQFIQFLRTMDKNSSYLVQLLHSITGQTHPKISGEAFLTHLILELPGLPKSLPKNLQPNGFSTVEYYKSLAVVFSELLSSPDQKIQNSSFEANQKETARFFNRATYQAVVEAGTECFKELQHLQKITSDAKQSAEIKNARTQLIKILSKDLEIQSRRIENQILEQQSKSSSCPKVFPSN